MKYHALFVIFENTAKFAIVVAANYRWRFKGQYAMLSGQTTAGGPARATGYDI